jgi:isoleucyl-tRNA synthetase
MTDTNDTLDYSKTLFLPKTDFPMRAGLPKKEPESSPEVGGRWTSTRSCARSPPGRPKYVLHDGPPYANGNIHIGHALNKILKDLITRSFQMRGYDSNYVPGWDCHGLPIEWKIEEESTAPRARTRTRCRSTSSARNAAPLPSTGSACRPRSSSVWASRAISRSPTLTMSFDAEARIAEELMKFAMSGQLYRGSKPVMWSVVERTALAEAEVEYQDYESDTVWVKFPGGRCDVAWRRVRDT